MIPCGCSIVHTKMFALLGFAYEGTEVEKACHGTLY